MSSDLVERWFRFHATGLSRRNLGTIAGLAVFGVASESAARKKEKRKCKRPCGECRACKRDKCKPAANGAFCTGGACIDAQCIASGVCAETTFCDAPEDPPQCQASGPDCFCELTTSGAHVCTDGASFHLEDNCRACTGPGELCLSLVGCPENADKVGCATPCSNPT
jgi:hypothetical protein